MYRILTALTASTLLLSACGGSSDASSDNASGQNEEMISSLATELASEPDSPISDPEDARCAAEKMVDGIGADRMKELDDSSLTDVGLGSLDLTDSEITVVVDALSECVDLNAFMVAELSGQFGEEAANCLIDELGDDFVNQLMAAGISGDDPTAQPSFLEKMTTASTTCGIG